MSAINSLMSTLGSAASNSTGSSSTSSPNSLTANDFIKFMITELQNQDPLSPTDPNTMLQQISEIGQLQSATTMQTDLTGMVQQNQVSAASAMIGKEVQGTDANSNSITGIVSAVQITSSGVSLELNTGSTLAMNNVTAITNAPTPSTAASGTSS
ncbi:MAG: flagellar hook capping FlgD N-terminal domain-containing protein [Tepidisphaeraceae bacterium]